MQPGRCFRLARFMFRVQKNFVHHRCIAPKTGGAVRNAVCEAGSLGRQLVLGVLCAAVSGFRHCDHVANPKP